MKVSITLIILVSFTTFHLWFDVLHLLIIVTLIEFIIIHKLWPYDLNDIFPDDGRGGGGRGGGGGGGTGGGRGWEEDRKKI